MQQDGHLCQEMLGPPCPGTASRPHPKPSLRLPLAKAREVPVASVSCRISDLAFYAQCSSFL